MLRQTELWLWSNSSLSGKDGHKAGVAGTEADEDHSLQSAYDSAAALSRSNKKNGRINWRGSGRDLMPFPSQVTFEYFKLVRLQYYNI